MSAGVLERTGRRGALGILLLIGLIVVGFPFYWMILTALTPREALFQPPFRLIRFDLSLQNFHDLLFATQFLIYLKNSLIAATGSIVLNVIAATLAGYGLSRFDFRAKGGFTRSILLSYMFPPMLLAIPLYIILASLHMRNTYTGLILAHTSVSLPINIWIMWQYFQIVPVSLEEAAWVSGASRLRTLLEVSLPSALPGIYSVAIFAFALSWNDFEFAFILQTNKEMFTLPVGLATFVEQSAINWGMIMCSAALISIPTFGLVFFLQKYLMRGLGLGR